MRDPHTDTSPAPRGLKNPLLGLDGGGSCGGSCDTCDTADAVRQAEQEIPVSELRASAASFSVFLLPLGLALVGASLGGSPITQILGGAIGVALGVLIARSLLRWLVPPVRETR